MFHCSRGYQMFNPSNGSRNKSDFLRPDLFHINGDPSKRLHCDEV